MAEIFLIHWDTTEAPDRADRVRGMGYSVRMESEDGARAGREILARLPAVVVIDLSRLPSHGRATAEGLRSYKAGRDIPIVFLPGEPDKMESVKLAVPDAEWSTWEELSTTLARLVSDNVMEDAASDRDSDPAIAGLVDEVEHGEEDFDAAVNVTMMEAVETPAAAPAMTLTRRATETQAMPHPEHARKRSPAKKKPAARPKPRGVARRKAAGAKKKKASPPKPLRRSAKKSAPRRPKPAGKKKPARSKKLARGRRKKRR